MEDHRRLAEHCLSSEVGNGGSTGWNAGHWSWQTTVTGEGVILRPCSSLHTAFMRFSIDVVFLDSGGRVRKVVENLRPFRLALVWGGRDAIEMAAGALQTADLQVGDRLIYKARDG